MGEETLQDGRAQTGPDESLSDVGIGGIEGVQVGVGFPFLEAYLNLPAKTVQFAGGAYREAITWEVGAQARHRGLLTRKNDQAKNRAFFAFAECGIKIESAVRILSEKGVEGYRLAQYRAALSVIDSGHVGFPRP